MARPAGLTLAHMCIRLFLNVGCCASNVIRMSFGFSAIEGERFRDATSRKSFQETKELSLG